MHSKVGGSRNCGAHYTLARKGKVTFARHDDCSCLCGPALALASTLQSLNNRRPPNCFAFPPFFTFSFFCILTLHCHFKHPHSFSNTVPASRFISCAASTTSCSSPLIIPGFRGAFGLVPRPFSALTRVARPFHTFTPNPVSVSRRLSPSTAIYAGVMASSDDDVPLKARKMKPNGVKQGKQSVKASQSASLRASSHTITNSLILLFLACHLSPLRLMPSP